MSTSYVKPNKPDTQPATTAGRPPSLPLYMAGIAAQLAGLSAVAFQIGEPAFAYFTMILTLIGATTAYFLRLRGVPPRMMQFGVIAVGLIFLYALRGSGVFAVLVPRDTQGTQEVVLVSTLAFTATFCTFLWLNDEAVAFSCVWSIAMIGLTGTININRELIIAFICFLAAATFLLVHQNSLAQSGGNAAITLDDTKRDRPASWRLLRTQAVMAAIAWAGSMFLGFLIAIPVQMVGRNLSLSTIIQRLKVPPTPSRRATSRPKLVFDSLTDFRVGLGPIDDDPAEKMDVLTEKPHYWRGRTFDSYTGRGWISTFPGQGEDVFATEGQDTPEGFSNFDLPTNAKPRRKIQRFTHRFRVVGGLSGALYHAAEPRRVRAQVIRVIWREDNTINAGRGNGSEYEVDSDIVDPSPSELRNSGTQYPTEITERYLDRGGNLASLQALANEALNGTAPNPYDRAQALRRFIANRCVYTREARAVPREKDATDFFLNESKEGYCDLYATSLAILCRYAGIPSRVATGYAPGNPATGDANVVPVAKGDKRQWYILRGSDLHAWTEVYFNNYGWIPLDATQDTGGTITPTTTPQPIKKKEGWKELWAKYSLSLVFIGIGVLGLLFVAYNEFASRFRPQFAIRSGKQYAASNEIANLYLRTVRQIARRGARRADTMTPSEYLRYLRENFDPTVAEALQPLTLLTEQALYGPDALTTEQKAEAHAAGRRVGTALKNYRKPKETSSGANR